MMILMNKKIKIKFAELLDICMKKKSQKSNGKISRNIVYLKYKKDAAMKRRQRVNEGGITRWA